MRKNSWPKHTKISPERKQRWRALSLWPERTRGMNFFRVDHNLQRFLTRYNPVLMQNEDNF